MLNSDSNAYQQIFSNCRRILGMETWDRILAALDKDLDPEMLPEKPVAIYDPHFTVLDGDKTWHLIEIMMINIIDKLGFPFEQAMFHVVFSFFNHRQDKKAEIIKNFRFFMVISTVRRYVSSLLLSHHSSPFFQGFC